MSKLSELKKKKDALQEENDQLEFVKCQRTHR